MKLKLSIIIAILVINIKALTFVEMFGMGDLLQDLAKLKVSNIEGADQKAATAYMLDPTIYNFLKQFTTRSEFCDYKCVSFFNLPCFILFDCNIQIRNFILIFLAPLIIVALAGICCGRGIWTFKCWMKYIAVFTGIGLLIWAIKKCSEGSSVRERKQK